MDEMIKSTPRGILVTRLWYLRQVDPRTILYTGLTRDGTFLIENGKISKAIKNFRFNESPLFMLNNLEAIGPAVRIAGNRGGRRRRDAGDQGEGLQLYVVCRTPFRKRLTEGRVFDPPTQSYRDSKGKITDSSASLQLCVRGSKSRASATLRPGIRSTPSDRGRIHG